MAKEEAARHVREVTGYTRVVQLIISMSEVGGKLGTLRAPLRRGRINEEKITRNARSRR